VLQRQDPRHARGHAGEQGLAFSNYRWEDGWGAIRGPSGSEGHPTTTRGEDGLFWNQRTRELHIVDNKSLARRGRVQSATAIDPERNLLQNIEDMIEHVERQSPSRESPNYLPMRQQVLRLLRQTRAALRSGSRIPGRVRLIVGNAGGRSTGIGTRLQRLGVELVDVNQPVVPRPGTGRTPLRGGGLSGGSAAFGFALGVASAAARGEAQARQRDTTGYAPVGPSAFAEEDFLSRAGRIVQDLDLGTQTPAEARFNVHVWRQRIRRHAARVPVGGTFTITWQWHHPHSLLFFYQIVEDIEVRYERRQDGTWIAHPQRRVPGFSVPDLGRILDASVSDDEIRWELLTPAEQRA
jgi:hypothetical protein